MHVSKGNTSMSEHVMSKPHVKSMSGRIIEDPPIVRFLLPRLGIPWKAHNNPGEPLTPASTVSTLVRE